MDLNDENFEKLLKKVKNQIENCFYSIININNDKKKEKNRFFPDFSLEISKHVKNYLKIEKDPNLIKLERVNEQQLLFEKCFDGIIFFFKFFTYFKEVKTVQNSFKNIQEKILILVKF